MTTLDLLAGRVRELLRQRQMTPTELAARAGRSQPLVSQFLSQKGPQRSISLETVDAFARALRVSPSDLLPHDPAALVLAEDERHLVEGFRRADDHIRSAVGLLLTGRSWAAPDHTHVASVSPEERRARLLARLADLTHEVETLPVSDAARPRSPAPARASDGKTESVS